MQKRRRKRPRRPQNPRPLGPLRHPQSLLHRRLRMPRMLRRPHLQEHRRRLALFRPQQRRLLPHDSLFRRPPRQLRLLFVLPHLLLRRPRRGPCLQLARRPRQERLRPSHLRQAQCVRQRLLQLPQLALRARLDRQVPRRRDNRDDFPPRVLVRASAKVVRALLRECVLRHRVNPGQAAHRGLLERRQDFRNGRGPDGPVRHPLEASVPELQVFQVCPRQNRANPCISESRPLRADVRRSKNATPKVSAGCIRFERAPAPERDAQRTLSQWPLYNASRGTSRLRKALPSENSPKKWIFAPRTC